VSVRGSFLSLKTSGVPAATSTALDTFEAYGNTVTLYITTGGGGGAGTCTFTMQSTHNGSDWFDVYDLDSAATWSIDVNTAGNYELTLPAGLIPRNQYKLFYSCGAAAGTIVINAISWENPAGSTDITVGDIHASITDMSVEGDVAHDAVDSGNPVKIGGHARTSQRTAVANGDRVDGAFDEFGQQVQAGFLWASRTAGVTEDDPVTVHYLNRAVNTDTTNVTATTHYYPSADPGLSMDGYSDFSFTGKLIDADGTLTLTLEGTNDEDTTSGDWHQVYFYDDINNATINSLTVTNSTLSFACSANNANFSNLRLKLIASGATNTVVIKGRQKAVS
jgi:hypothetical protein